MLYPNRGHTGSIDVDFAVAATAIACNSYQTIIQRMLAAHYTHKDNPTHFLKTVSGAPEPVKVDLISGQYQAGEKSATIQVEELRLNTLRGIDLAFEACDEIEIAGQMPDGVQNLVRVRIARAEVFILIKAFALDERKKEKDAYDIAFVLQNYQPDLASLAERVRPHVEKGLGNEAYAILKAKFASMDSVGPDWAAKVVAVFSFEMSKEEMFDRLFAKSLGVEAWKLSKGIFTEIQFQEMGPILDQFNDYPLYICDDANSDLVNIRSKARRHQMRHGLDLLIVDYLQLIEVTDRFAGENQTQRITYISKSLKRLARELQCPVLALSQLSRECDRRPDKRPQLSDLRDSGSIEQDGDRILMLYRESEYFEDCDNPDVTNVYVRKNRHGPTGCIDLRFDKKRMSFETSE